MSKAYLFSGLPGSGKSTIANKMAEKDPHIVIINADSIGQMLRGNYALYSQEDNFKTMRSLTATIVQDTVKRAIDGGFDFIIDETLRSRGIREQWVKFIYTYCCQTFKSYKIILVALPEISIQDSLQNRMKNPKGVSRRKWKEIITRMDSNWESVLYGTFDKTPYPVDIHRFESVRPFNKTVDFLLGR